MDSSSHETKSQELYISNQDTLRSLMETQKQLINLEKSLARMRPGRDADLRQHVLYF